MATCGLAHSKIDDAKCGRYEGHTPNIHSARFTIGEKEQCVDWQINASGEIGFSRVHSGPLDIGPLPADLEPTPLPTAEPLWEHDSENDSE